MNNIFEESSRVCEYDDNYVATNFRRPIIDEDGVEVPKVLYILLLLFLRNCFNSWLLHLDITIVS